MKTNTLKKILVTLLAFFFACSIGAFALTNVNAEEPAREFTMNKGASIRLVEDSKGIRFSATLSSYDEANDYGFVIVPRRYLEDHEITDNYVTELQALAEAGTIADPIILYSTVHEEGGKNVIKGSITNILYENINLEFVGIGFEYDGTNYNYATFEDLDYIARTTPSVAAACLNELYYDANISDDHEILYRDSEAILKNYINESINAKAGLSEEQSDATVPTYELAFAQEEISIGYGESVQLELNSNIADYVTYSSDNEAITVDANGLVTAKGVGTATITVKGLGIEDTCTVTASALEVADGYVAEYNSAAYEVSVVNDIYGGFWKSDAVTAEYVASGVTGAKDGDALKVSVDVAKYGTDKGMSYLTLNFLGGKGANLVGDSLQVRYRSTYDEGTDAELFLYVINGGTAVTSNINVTTDSDGWKLLTIALADISGGVENMSSLSLAFFPYNFFEDGIAEVYFDYIKTETLKPVIEAPQGYLADYNTELYEEMIVNGYSSADGHWKSGSLVAEYVASDVAGAKDGDAMKLTLGVNGGNRTGFQMQFGETNVAGSIVEVRIKAKDGSADAPLFLYGVNDGTFIQKGYTVSAADSNGWRTISIEVSSMGGVSVSDITALGLAFYQYVNDTTTAEVYIDYVKVVSPLATPTNFAYANGTLTWDAVANAASYVVAYDGQEYPVTTNSVEVASGKSVTVKAVAGEGFFVDSTWSAAYVTVGIEKGYLVNYNDALYESMVTNASFDSYWTATGVSATYTASGVTGAENGDALVVAISNNKNGYSTVTLNMPTAAAGSLEGTTVQIRFRLTDNGVAKQMYLYTLNGGATPLYTFTQTDDNGWTIFSFSVSDPYSVSSIGLSFHGVTKDGTSTLELDYVKVV